MIKKFSFGQFPERRLLFLAFAAATNENDKAQKHVLLKNNTPFTSNMSKINNPFINNAKDFYIAMAMYKLLEYSYNYSIAARRLTDY